MPTDDLVAQVLVSKYADHLPLYRQAQIYARQGITLDRSTLADWAEPAKGPAMRSIVGWLVEGGGRPCCSAPSTNGSSRR